MSYTAKVAMPVVAPPAAGGSYPAASDLTVTSLATHQQLQIDIDVTVPPKLYAMSGGLVTYVPAGKPLPTPGADPSPGAGSVVLQTWAADVAWLKQSLPAGIPPLIAVIYMNVTDSTAQAALDPVVRAMTDKQLTPAWDKPNPNPTKTDLENRFLERLMLGETAALVEGGALLGNAEHIDPNDVATDIRVTLWCLSGSGADLSPVMNIRTMPNYGGSDWTGHPLIDALSQVTVPADIYVRFEVYDATAQQFDPLPAGTSVDLMDYDAISGDDARQTQTTDANGSVHFSFADGAQAFSSDNDVYFLAHTNNVSVAGTTIPNDWSTRGWLATDGSPGYCPDFAGSRIGDPNTPVTFRVGVDVHAKFAYDNPNFNPPKVPDLDIPAPKGVKVYLKEVGTATPVLPVTTGDNGEVHGLTFALEGGESLYWFTDFEIEADPSIGLKQASVDLTGGGWSTEVQDEGAPFYPNNNLTSLGEVAKPDQVNTTLPDRVASFYVLKTLREVSIFFTQLTGGDWPGVDNLTYDLLSVPGVQPFSWPEGSIHLTRDYYRNRGAIWHETSHQIMWIEMAGALTSLGIAYQELNPAGSLYLQHDMNMKATGMQALVEGWAEFIEEVATSSPWPSRPWDVNQLKQPPSTALGSLDFIDPPEYLLNVPASAGPEATVAPKGTGELVEGVFANGLWEIVRNLVDGSGTVDVPVSPDGDVTATAPWITDAGKQARFQSMIWKPLKDLSAVTNPTTHDFIAAIKANNPADWHRILPQLQKWSMAMTIPTVTAVSPGTGSIAGGDTVTVTGDDFPANVSKVMFGGTDAPSFSVTSATSISAVTPSSSTGAVEVEVQAPAGTGSLAGGFRYV